MLTLKHVKSTHRNPSQSALARDPRVRETDAEKLGPMF